MLHERLALAVSLALLLCLDVGCDSSSGLEPDAGDAAFADASPRDLGTPDAVPADLGGTDAGRSDGEAPDASSLDADLPDTAVSDASSPDAEGPDTGPPDLGFVGCGDGLFQGSEQCDDGNMLGGDGCTDDCLPELGWTCTSTPSVCVTECGDNIQAGAEACDDGNLIDGDSCESDCTLPFCGNAITDQDEECDDGNLVNGDACNTNCTFPGCGNGIIDPFEFCDDGNADPTDGCDACFATYTCGNGSLEPGEECEDGNLLDRDGCSALCQVEVCGNGNIDAGEECDDGNLINGDGCNSACLVDRFVGDFVSSGYGGIRESGLGQVIVSGTSGIIERALLYWHGPTNISDPSANAVVEFSGQVIIGRNIGLSSDNCWGFTNSQAYRADVTSLISGNGTYAFAGFSRTDVDVNGVSLLVFFDDGDPSNDWSVHLFEGNDSNVNNPYDAEGWNQSYGGLVVSSSLTPAFLELHVADGQDFDDGSVSLNQTELLPFGSNFQGTTVPNGPGAIDTAGGLWDIRRFSVEQFLSTGNNQVDLSALYSDDCLSLISAVWLLRP